MHYPFSDPIEALKPSVIREILKVSNDINMIPFGAGSPASETFPIKEMAEIAADIFKNDAEAALQYGTTEGYPPLRTITKQRLQEKYNIGTDEDDILITSGGQQAIELAAKSFLNRGDVVICEELSFIGALNAFRSFGAKLISCDMDKDGMNIDALEQLLIKTPKAKMIYTIPTFQNPTGRTMSAARRVQLIELANKYDVIILEDNPYFELRYSGEDEKTLKSMDTDGRVIYAGSYSKVLAPGIRIGFACANKEIIAKMTVCKQIGDVHTNAMFQMIVAEYMSQYDLDARIETIQDLYRGKRDVMCAAIEKHFDKRVRTYKPDGGLFIWCELPDGVDSMELCQKASKRNVMAVPGVAFVVEDDQICNGIRLNFSLPAIGKIGQGIEILAEEITKLLEQGART